MDFSLTQSFQNRFVKGLTSRKPCIDDGQVHLLGAMTEKSKLVRLDAGRSSTLFLIEVDHTAKVLVLVERPTGLSKRWM